MLYLQKQFTSSALHLVWPSYQQYNDGSLFVLLRAPAMLQLNFSQIASTVFLIAYVLNCLLSQS